MPILNIPPADLEKMYAVYGEGPTKTAISKYEEYLADKPKKHPNDSGHACAKMWLSLKGSEERGYLKRIDGSSPASSTKAVAVQLDAYLADLVGLVLLAGKGQEIISKLEAMKTVHPNHGAQIDALLASMKDPDLDF